MGKHIKSATQGEAGVYSRRFFLTSVAAAWAGVAANALAQTKPGSKRSSMVTVEAFSPAGKSEGRMQLAKVIKSDAEWRKQLSADSYDVTRKEGTEFPFSGEYLENHAAGIYRCICCETALFDAATKFESDTGWPSFWKPISRTNVVETPDISPASQRTAVSCVRCDAHLGHVFDDGPKPTGLRYCMNSVALHFVSRA